MAARILYVPNEHGSARQSGIRTTFSRLRSGGCVSDVKIFSLLWRIREGMDGALQRRKLVQLAADYRPDIILMQHLGGTGIVRDELKELKDSCDALIYHEADPYSRLVHGLPREAREAGAVADVVFTVGTGTFARNFERAGASDVQWEPSIFDSERFGRERPLANHHRDFDIVMVANRNRPRLRGLPNWRDRIRFVNYMETRFGSRFAIFGRGWTGPSAQGTVAYSDQSSAIRSGWVSANWDHFALEPKYFSDRLPTSLATGSVHATTAHPGFDQIFPGAEPFLLMSKSMVALGDRIEQYLTNVDADERIEREAAAWEFAHRHFRQDDQLVRMLNRGGAGIDQSSYEPLRELRVDALDEM